MTTKTQTAQAVAEALESPRMSKAETEFNQQIDAIYQHATAADKETLGDMATLEQCNHWWRNRDKPKTVASNPSPVFFHEPNLEAFSAPHPTERMDKPAIGAEHEPIRVHTVEIWPNPHAKYDFEQAWAAFHFWQDIGRHMASLKDEGSEVRGRFLMELKRWLECMPRMVLPTPFTRSLQLSISIQARVSTPPARLSSSEPSRGQP